MPQRMCSYLECYQSRYIINNSLLFLLNHTCNKSCTNTEVVSNPAKLSNDHERLTHMYDTSHFLM